MDTSLARKAIFARIRQAQQRPDSLREAELREARAWLERPEAGPQPTPPTDLLAQFCERARQMADTVEVVPSIADVPQAVADYMQQAGVGKNAVAWPELADLSWQASGLQVAFRALRDGEQVGITGAFCGLAETGSLLLLSGPAAQVACAMLPETHIAILPVTRILHSMEQAFTLHKAERGSLPRTASFISGPSRTADIEQTIVLGAHGPYRVHVVLHR